eukprot:6118639-Pyramimonas_sp.AAC.1
MWYVRRVAPNNSTSHLRALRLRHRLVARPLRPLGSRKLRPQPGQLLLRVALHLAGGDQSGEARGYILRAGTSHQVRREGIYSGRGPVL